MRNIRLIIAYEGTCYLGWQKTNMGPSIERALERALHQILREHVLLQAASRTDAGVHAEGQTINFLTQNTIELWRLNRSLNGVLPRDIRVISLTEIPRVFHPTLDTVGKEYTYQICYGPVQLPFYRHLSWHFSFPLNLFRMRQAAAHLIGTHDFSTFCNERQLWTRTPTCTLNQITVEPLSDDRLLITVQGDHFLYKMVRNLVGTLAYIGCGKLSSDAILAILNSRDRIQAGMTAPAHGLCLKRVFYGQNLDSTTGR